VGRGLHGSRCDLEQRCGRLDGEIEEEPEHKNLALLADQSTERVIKRRALVDLVGKGRGVAIDRVIGRWDLLWPACLPASVLTADVDQDLAAVGLRAALARRQC
jgi:hypothetical protein